ncbi:hypothetical protein [Acidihalobacter aeolianus]|uniref:hypothetical protein n=1 Tax=Acidihalobacter aeolianus TaxID=2792603 RepID=UPI0012EA8FA9|nr:hypothetical protein [Acidihalobacter aeolianus]
MTYCRFSDDDYQCDVLVYNNVHGTITIQVASMRRIYTTTLPPRVPFSIATVEAWMERENTMREIRRRHCISERIGYSYDGHVLRAKTPLDALEALELLRHIGYRVPQYAIDALRTEHAKANPTEDGSQREDDDDDDE